MQQKFKIINMEQDQIIKSQSDLEEAKKEAQENLDGWKRAKADFINYKKRQEELMDEFRKFACENAVEDFIPILDSMELSLEHIPEDQKKSEWIKGVVHIKKMLEDALKANGVEAVDSKEGGEFNPEIHEAVEMGISEEQEGKNPAKIKKILRKGYRLNGKIIRAAKVIVE